MSGSVSIPVTFVLMSTRKTYVFAASVSTEMEVSFMSESVPETVLPTGSGSGVAAGCSGSTSDKMVTSRATYSLFVSVYEISAVSPML